MNELDERMVDELLRNTLAGSPAADFDVWQSRHGEAVAYLNPIATTAYHRRRRMMMRIATGTVAAILIVALGSWFFVFQERSFAQVIDDIEKAETISFSIKSFIRRYSLDGERTWIEQAPRMERAYLALGRYRDTRYDKDGKVTLVDIADVATGNVLRLDMKKREAVLKKELSGQYGPGNPFAVVAEILDRESIEFVGEQEIDGMEVNVFRHDRELPNGQSETWKIWLDAESKQLVGYCATPGDVAFDPMTAPDRDNPAEPRFSKGVRAGTITSDIIFDAELDPELFSLTPPDGFKVVEPEPRPQVSEAMLVEWLRVTAETNEGNFPDTTRGLSRERQMALVEMPAAERSEAEQSYLDLARNHQLDGNSEPMSAFAREFTEPRSFRYLGKGVRLGDSERLILFYKLTTTGTYRAMYGDLAVKEVQPSDLPLPVQD
ncbi:MAG: hypothetical protein WDZ59_17175 [Pirellulales bacterium]